MSRHAATPFPSGELLPGLPTAADLAAWLLEKSHWLVICFNRLGRPFIRHTYKSADPLLGGFLDQFSLAWNEQLRQHRLPRLKGVLPYLLIAGRFEHAAFHRCPIHGAIGRLLIGFHKGQQGHEAAAGAYELKSTLIPDRKAFVRLRKDLDNHFRLATRGRRIADASEALDSLQAINQEISAAHEPIIERFQQFLRSLEGRSFETFAENQQVTAIIQDTLNRLRLAVRCTREDRKNGEVCGQPAKIRCKKAGNTKTGAFQFEHFDGKLTHHQGRNVFPRLDLVPVSRDRRRKIRTDVHVNRES